MQIEHLESRTLFAVTVHTADLEAANGSLTPTVAAAKKTAKLSAPIKTTVAAPVANPSVTDPSISYQNFSTDPLFSPSGPTASDVNQGDLGDCYFMASLAAVAKVDPKLITQDITANSDGTYTVKLFSGGAALSVRVSDTLPVFSDGAVAYAGLGNDNCTWVAILEKAYAVVRTGSDSYASLNGGWMSDAFNALGVKNTSLYTAVSATVLGKTLATDQKAGDAMTFATGDAIADSAPLYADHAYSVDSFALTSRGQLLWLTLRNPWGNTEPNDGNVTLTAKQAMDNFNGLVVGLV